MLWCCFAVKLQKCIVDYKLHLTFLLHGGESITEFFIVRILFFCCRDDLLHLQFVAAMLPADTQHAVFCVVGNARLSLSRCCVTVLTILQILILLPEWTHRLCKMRPLIIQAAEAFMTDFDADPERQVDTFLWGELAEPQKSQDRTEQI